jgi:hypothetical protein
VQAVLGHHPWGTHAEILEAVATHPRVAVKACHASSKTFAAAELALWWISRYNDGIVITTAPKFEQVEKLLWMELHKALRGSTFKYPKPNLTELKLEPGNYAVGWSTSEGINFQGIHGPHVLIVIDEAPGVEAEIWEAIEGARAGGDVHILALGNPTIAGGPFYEAFTERRSGWKTITIDAFATPNLEDFTLELLRSLPPDLPADRFNRAPIWSAAAGSTSGFGSGVRSLRCGRRACVANSRSRAKMRSCRWRGWRPPAPPHSMLASE